MLPLILYSGFVVFNHISFYENHISVQWHWFHLFSSLVIWSQGTLPLPSIYKFMLKRRISNSVRWWVSGPLVHVSLPVSSAQALRCHHHHTMEGFSFPWSYGLVCLAASKSSQALLDSWPLRPRGQCPVYLRAHEAGAVWMVHNSCELYEAHPYCRTL